jgi:hypothetical protein
MKRHASGPWAKVPVTSVKTSALRDIDSARDETCQGWKIKRRRPSQILDGEGKQEPKAT